jgi:hypothetical protein
MVYALKVFSDPYEAKCGLDDLLDDHGSEDLQA